VAERILIDIATTEGPATVRAAEFDSEAPRSAMVLFDQNHIALGADAHFDAFDRRLRRHLRALGLAIPDGGLILELDRPVDAGASWQLGLVLAHLALAGGRLATREADAGRAVWVTGAVGTSAWAARGVEAVALKLARAGGRLGSLRARGLAVDALVPEENLEEARRAAPVGIVPEPVGPLPALLARYGPAAAPPADAPLRIAGAAADGPGPAQPAGAGGTPGAGAGARRRRTALGLGLGALAAGGVAALIAGGDPARLAGDPSPPTLSDIEPPPAAGPAQPDGPSDAAGRGDGWSAIAGGDADGSAIAGATSQTGPEPPSLPGPAPPAGLLAEVLRAPGDMPCDLLGFRGLSPVAEPLAPAPDDAPPRIVVSPFLCGLAFAPGPAGGSLEIALDPPRPAGVALEPAGFDAARATLGLDHRRFRGPVRLAVTLTRPDGRTETRRYRLEAARGASPADGPPARAPAWQREWDRLLGRQ
jgi:hypothetical protein